MGAVDKVKLLIWKNFIVQRRHKWLTLFEIASPVVFSMLLIFTRLLVDPKSNPDVAYTPFKPVYFNNSNKLTENITVSSKTLAFSPENPLTRKVAREAWTAVAEELAKNMNSFDFSDYFSLLLFYSLLPEPKGYKNAQEMEAALTQPNAMKDIIAGVQFDDNMANATEWPDDIKVALRFPAVMRMLIGEHPLKASWRTSTLFPLFPLPGPRDPEDRYGGSAPGYAPEMFLAFQHAVSQEIIRQKSGEEVNTTVYLQRLPQAAYREDPLLIVLERFIPIVINLCYTYSFVNTVRMITAEKELQLKETMAIMGLPSWTHWLAWFIKQFAFLLVSVAIIVILFKIPLNKAPDGVNYAILTHTPWSVLAFFMILFIMASLTFSFMISVFFSKANSAASFMGLAWVFCYSGYMLTQMMYDEFGVVAKILICLISNSAIGFALQMMVICEGTGTGLQWDNFFTSVSYKDEFVPGHVALMLVVDSVLYMLVAMYVEKIRPGLYGVPLPWYFPFTKSFWRPDINKTTVITNNKDLEYNEALLKVVHDEEPVGIPIGVNIQNLTKVYRGRRKAVDNLTLRIYENEITVLLGHNGAGKTSTISMLTGLVPPTSGNATISGYSIVSDTEQARRSLGICPQHNVLFPDLTVAEHIIFYSRLKGVPANKIKDEVDHFVKLLELETKRDVLSNKLSGGQKRRLSVGAAMCGSSRVVLLDEPTSGLDPASRRALWDLLLKEKRGRTMILTTHFMDEADVLGDRIAIMSGGRLQCVGTPYFLKKHYGIGYKLTIVKEEQCIVSDVTRFLKQYVPDIKDNTNIGTELTYILPNDNVNKFPEMLKQFDKNKNRFGVSSYGLSVTSLEEVFMKAGVEEVSNITTSEEKIYRNAHYSDSTVVPLGSECIRNTTIDSDFVEKVKGFQLLKNHIKAMFLKLAYNSMRNKLTALIQFISPVINIILSVIISRSWKFISQLPPLTLSLESGFEKTQTIISRLGNLSDDSMEAKTMNAFKDYLVSSPYTGLTFIDIGPKNLEDYYLTLSKADLKRVRFETLMGATFSENNITAWFGNYGYHDSAISLAMINNAVMRAISPNTTLKIVNHPLPYSIENLVKVMASGSSMGFQFAFNMGFCMAFVTAFLVLFVIKERRSGAKLLQRVSGVRPAVMWGVALLWDWIWLLLVYLCIVATLAYFQETTLSSPAELGRVLLVLVVFSLAIIPIHYLASFYFEAAATGFSKMCFINIFTGCMPFLITEVLLLPQVGSPFYAHLFDWIFSPLPIYSVSRSFRDMSVASFRLAACDGLCHQLNVENCTRHTVCTQLKINVCCIDDDPFMNWSEPGIGRYLFMMTMVGVIAFVALLLKEYEIFKMVVRSLTRRADGEKEIAASTFDEEDEDVARERHNVQALTRSELQSRSLVCRDLTKRYRNFVAVNRLTFGVSRGECFGLLGVNGAGKTSTFRMLTGDARASAGDAFVHGYSVRRQVRDVHRLIGYCPQFDALFDNLTARETLRIFSLLRGIPEHEGAARAARLADELGFSRHYDKKVHECSGGTKRKVSTAVALLGDAPLVFLDEPTTGMDPASKRLVWASVSAAAVGGRSVVLTSHSMEECEALCSRLTVMVNGTLRCLGSTQHLKTKFSQGYTLLVKSAAGPERDATSASVEEYIGSQFSDVKLIETYLGISTYYVRDAVPWWRVFRVMEEARARFPLEDYSVTQTTLEQVFLQFARLQKDSK